jgi:hypothetical protein
MIFPVENIISFFVGRIPIQTVLTIFRMAKLGDSENKIYVALSDIVLAWRAEIGFPHGATRMESSFHPSPHLAFLTPTVENDMRWMSGKGRLPAYTKSSNNADDILSLIEWIKIASTAVGITGIKGFVKTSSKKEEIRRTMPRRGHGRRHAARSMFRNKRRVTFSSEFRKTCVAKFILAPQKTMHATRFKYHPDRIRAIKCLSVLVGRMKILWPAWISSKTAPIAKSGLVTPLLNEVLTDMGETIESFVEKYPAAALLLATTVSTFSGRKAFTLKSQKQGALNDYQIRILDIVYASEPTALRAIALILPINEVYSKIPQEDAVRVYQHSMKWLNLCGRFYSEQWSKGVAKCVRRNCRVPPRGTKVNTTAVNCVADAWMNLRRFQTISASHGKIPNAPLILKLMQLVANDQFKWGAGKIDSNARVFKSLTTQGIYPWEAVLSPESFDTRKALTVLMEACKEAECGVETWIGIAKLRKGEVTAHVDMICGCQVPPMSKECADFLVSAGLFGVREWAGT